MSYRTDIGGTLAEFSDADGLVDCAALAAALKRRRAAVDRGESTARSDYVASTGKMWMNAERAAADRADGLDPRASYLRFCADLWRPKVARGAR